MNKAFHISNFLIEAYAFRKRKQMLRFLGFNTIFMVSLVIILTHYDKIDKLSGFIILSMETVLAFLVLRYGNPQRQLEKLKFIIDRDRIFVYDDDKLSKEIGFDEIGVIKKNNWGIKLFRKSNWLNKEDQAYIQIPNALEDFDIFEKELLNNCPTAKKIGF